MKGEKKKSNKIATALNLESAVLHEIANTRLKTIVSISNIKETINQDLIDIYKELEKYESRGILEYNFLTYCSKCNTQSEIYESLNQIKDEFNCSNCKNKLNPFEDTILIFRKVREL